MINIKPNALIVCMLFLIPTIIFGQSAILDLESTNQGVLMPRMTESQRDAINLPAASLIIYQTNITPGFYYNSGTAASPDWQPLAGMTTVDLNPCETRTAIDTLPFEILSSGSYFVSKHLVGQVDQNGIRIATSNVTIDLNGFTLLSGGGTSGDGIFVDGPQNNIHIYNGIIQDWGDEGIQASNAQNSVIENVKCYANQSDGIYVGNNNRIINCHAAFNLYDGIDAGTNCIIESCIANNNSDNGIESGIGNIINSSAAYLNVGNGIETNASCTVNGNSSYENDENGFSIGNGNTVKGNSAAENTLNGFDINTACIVENNTSRHNYENGFETLQETFLKDNVADQNISAGFYTSWDDVRMDNNHATDNGTFGFHVDGASNCLVIRNTAISNSVGNFSISVGNSKGPIVGANLSTVTNPFANISL